MESIRVLYVDADDSVAETTDALERVSDVVTAETAMTANDALDKLEAATFNCIEFLRTVREQNRPMPFILFAEEGSERVAGDAIAADMTGYLQRGSDD